MSDGRKNSPNSSSLRFLCVFLISITTIFYSNDASSQKIYKPLTPRADTLPKPAVRDTLPVSDTLPPAKDSVNATDSLVPVTDTLNVQLSKDTLDAPIDYAASDSIVFLVPEKKIILYSQGSVKKGDTELTSDSIEIDQETKIVTARSRRDSTGYPVAKPKMTQGETTMESDEIQYNTKTQKGLTKNTLTQQGEIFIQGEKVKKVGQNDFFAYRGEFTTCNLDTPHFAFVTKKMKLVNKKLAVSGPIHPEFEGVPIPVYLPFGIFPISQGRHSGFLPPQFTANEQFGLGLQNMGYYKVFNDNFDIEARGDIYTYGGWTLNLTPTYRVRYRYNGRMLLTVQRTRMISEDPKQDFTDQRTFRINWSHTVDGKARPGQSFSANVNAGSTKFNRLYQGGDPRVNYQNMMTSSISYSKTWDAFNLTASANHSQNNNTREVRVTLPNVGFTANTFYPFQRQDYAGTPKWYEKLGIGLNSSFANQINFYDSLFSFSRILDTLEWGAQHNIPIQLSLPPVGPLQIAPGISYSNKWFSQQFIRTWNDAEQKVDTTINKGFYTQHDVSFSLSLSTALFGKIEKFGKNSPIRAIRHVIRPTVALSYKPDLTAGDFYKTRLNKEGREVRFSKYEGSIFSPFGGGTFGGISFGLDNNIEAKVRSKKDTAEGGLKKIRLIDGFGFNGSYNLMADSFALSNISLYVRSTLFDKVNLTAGATVDPYKTDRFGDRVDTLAWKGGKFSLGQITSGNIAISTSFQSKKKENAPEEEDVIDENMPPLTMEEQMSQVEYARQNPSEFADFNIPWSVNISYSLSFYRRFKRDYTGFETEINSNASIGGDFNLTPRWKMGLNSYYDFKTSKIQMLTMFISREMHCWQMSINVTPVGIYRSFNITISPKSGILRDLRINRTRSFYGG
ncbi:MAG: LPS-assembly protein LptD [Chitinophagaceae bacterium]|nr:LPS-assembly protein LptD [Chitinophagaceae bacterium]